MYVLLLDLIVDSPGTFELKGSDPSNNIKWENDKLTATSNIDIYNNVLQLIDNNLNNKIMLK